MKAVCMQCVSNLNTPEFKKSTIAIKRDRNRHKQCNLQYGLVIFAWYQHLSYQSSLYISIKRVLLYSPMLNSLICTSLNSASSSKLLRSIETLVMVLLSKPALTWKRVNDLWQPSGLCSLNADIRLMVFLYSLSLGCLFLS